MHITPIWLSAYLLLPPLLSLLDKAGYPYLPYRTKHTPSLGYLDGQIGGKYAAGLTLVTRGGRGNNRYFSNQ